MPDTLTTHPPAAIAFGTIGTLRTLDRPLAAAAIVAATREAIQHA